MPMQTHLLFATYCVAAIQTVATASEPSVFSGIAVLGIVAIVQIIANGQR